MNREAVLGLSRYITDVNALFSHPFSQLANKL